MTHIDNSLGLLSDQAINWMRVREDIHLEIIDATITESLHELGIFTTISDLNKSLSATVNFLKITEPIQDDSSKKLVATQYEPEELEEDLWLQNHHSTKLERGLDKSKSEPEILEQTDIAQLQAEQDLLLHEV